VIAIDENGNALFKLDSLGNQIPLDEDTVKIKKDTIRPVIKVEKIKQ